MRIAFGVLLFVLSAGSFVSAQEAEKHADQTIAGTGYTGAPYSARETIVNVRTSAEGVKYSNTYTMSLWRDSEGRTREEQVETSPSGVDSHSVTVLDPVAGTSLKWRFPSDLHTKVVLVSPLASRQRVTEPVSSAFGLPAANPSQPTPHPVPYGCPDCTVKSEFLGAQQINGLRAVGLRIMRTYKAGVLENGENFVATTVNETWTSPALRIIVRNINELPELGKTTINVTDIVQGDQDPALFQAPQGYDVHDATGAVTQPCNPGEAAKHVATGLDGTWVNVDPQTANLVRIEIDGSNVHPSARCNPRSCDWGILHGKNFAASVSSSGVDAMTAEMQTSFSKITLTLILQADGRLRVDAFTQFTDGSQRADYHHVDYLVRENSSGEPVSAAPTRPRANFRTAVGSFQRWNADLLIPPTFYAVQGAPFDALVEEDRVPANSSRERTRRFVRVMRDGEGRQRYEDLADAACSDCQAVPTSVRVIDLVGHRSIRLDPANETAVSCPLQSTSPPIRVPASELSDGGTKQSAQGGWLGRLFGQGGSGSGRGALRIAGLQATESPIPGAASRGQSADAQHPQVVDELWTSPLYRMPLKRVIVDPEYGEIDIQVVRFKAGEPRASLFQVPNGYAMRTEVDSACGTKPVSSRR